MRYRTPSGQEIRGLLAHIDDGTAFVRRDDGRIFAVRMDASKPGVSGVQVIDMEGISVVERH